ncbi:hypothetical protein CAP35_03555 [Chitinophagaceae bacterium IBVUCB1]|nr:hypothetical protein CAP35_03555 [Chitinophagaceae bacterium IBVUCB1]
MLHLDINTKPAIIQWLRFNKQSVIKGGSPLLSFNEPVDSHAPELIYRGLQYNYAKFFKMDLISKWAWLGAEALLKTENGYLYDGMDKTKIAIVLQTNHGCLDVDKRYSETLATIPSPALFVYTLPNIMLGEICIRHGFKGEQACVVSNGFDVQEMEFWVNDLLNNRGMDACLCGWVDATAGTHDVCLFWVTKQNAQIVFSADAMSVLYNK